MSYILADLASVVAISGAIYLAYQGKEGWGWLIFAGIVLGAT